MLVSYPESRLVFQPPIFSGAYVKACFQSKSAWRSELSYWEPLLHCAWGSDFCTLEPQFHQGPVICCYKFRLPFLASQNRPSDSTCLPIWCAGPRQRMPGRPKLMMEWGLSLRPIPAPWQLSKRKKSFKFLTIRFDKASMIQINLI